MATYVNDLRLKEIGTGESSGTWGTETNVNLELIGESLSFGTEAITTNADTHTSTVADGSTDPARSMFIKYTGTLDSACTITIAPNTISRLHFIENGTSGSQNIIISQGSGANVTIPPGDVKVVYLDGAGSGAAVVDAFASLNVVDLKVEDDLTVTDDASVGGDLLVSGEVQTANIGFTDGDNAITISDGGGTSFAQAVTANAGVVVDNITIDGTEIDLSSGDLTLDVAGDIILDAGGADILLKDDGTQFGNIGKGGGSDLIITASIADKDIFFTGTDGSSAITALTLDMSDAGKAIFNDKASFAGAIAVGQTTFTGGSVLADFHGSGSGTGASAAFYNDHNTVGFFVGLAGNTTGNALLYNTANTDIEFYTNNGIAMTLKNSRRLGIGVTAPDSLLHVDGSLSGGPVCTIHQTAGASSADRGLDVETSSTGTTIQRWLNSGSELARINGSGRFLVGTTVAPQGTGFAVNSGISSSSTTAIEIQQATSGANKAAAALGLAIQNGGESTNAADLFFQVATGGSLAERLRITSGGIVQVPVNNNAYNFQVFATDPDSFFGIRDDANDSVILQMDRSDGFTAFTVNGHTAACTIGGALSKASGSFKIDHPLEAKKDTHHLVHSFIEGPQADLIYRGRVALSGGSASVNIDTASDMTSGTFVVLCRDVQCFTSNETGWTAVKGVVSGNTLTITAEDATCTDTISWMVVGERQDPHMKDALTDWTDSEGKIIVEPRKEA